MSAWEQMRDYTTGYLTEWRDVARWRAKVTQQGIGGTRWGWQVSKVRDTAGPRGEWHDMVAYGTEDTRAAAKARASLILRASVMTQARAMRLAKQATRHGYFYADYCARAYCPRCRERVERTVDVNLDRATASGRLRPITSMALTQLHAAIADHLVHSCEWVLPEREVKLLLEGRRDG